MEAPEYNVIDLINYIIDKVKEQLDEAFDKRANAKNLMDKSFVNHFAHAEDVYVGEILVKFSSELITELQEVRDNTQHIFLMKQTAFFRSLNQPLAQIEKVILEGNPSPTHHNSADRLAHEFDAVANKKIRENLKYLLQYADSKKQRLIKLKGETKNA